MTPLSKEFVDNCPIEGNFRLRGMEMTRIEVFVDAAFAFAVTMLVISFDAIPTNFPELVLAIKGIPAFIVAVIQLVWIWYAHNIWSKRFGLENPMAVALSTVLLMVMLIYIYPMRIMAQGMFSWFTNEYLPAGFNLNSYDELSSLFVFLGVGFIAMCMVFVMMYRYAGSLKAELLLNETEYYYTQTFQIMWLGAAAIGGLSAILAKALPLELVPFAGFAFTLLSVWFPWISKHRRKHEPLNKQI